MRSFILLSGILFSLNSFAANPLQKYLGCYDVVSFNGSDTSRYDVDAVIEDGVGSVMRYAADPQTHEDIRAVNVVISFAVNQPGPLVRYPYNYENSAFNDRGVYTSDGNGDHYRFDGVILEDDLTTVHSRLDVKRQSDTTLQVDFSWNEVTEKGMHFTSDSTRAVLRQKQCPDGFDPSHPSR